ncbi:hypothetical protein ACFVWG_28010 [Kribbella sp. NPDC058245]|uniref:hypothetical protein n=1 Tax=Kribbella sp. NPDC058245 TaxID=3346399 RepID=UPI0036F0D2C5
MKHFWVHGVAGLDDDATERITRRHPGWRFTDGAPPPDAAYDVLVARSPTRELVAASPQLRTLVVPFAGVRAADAATGVTASAYPFHELAQAE